MKKVILALFCLVCMFMGQGLSAQSKPISSAKYSEDQICEMIYSFEYKKSRDVWADSALKSKFRKDFAEARDVDWEKIDNIYEVEFEIGYIDYKAYYDEAFELIMYQYEINIHDLPAIIKNAAITKYPDFHFEDAKEIHSNSGIIYKVELDHHKDVYLLISQKGKILKEWLD